MKGAPVPPLTLYSLTGAIADVVRSAMVVGAEMSQKEPADAVYRAAVQYVAQLLALVLQRDPTEDELALIFNQLGNFPT